MTAGDWQIAKFRSMEGFPSDDIKTRHPSCRIAIIPMSPSDLRSSGATGEPIVKAVSTIRQTTAVRLTNSLAEYSRRDSDSHRDFAKIVINTFSRMVRRQLFFFYINNLNTCFPFMPDQNKNSFIKSKQEANS